MSSLVEWGVSWAFLVLMSEDMDTGWAVVAVVAVVGVVAVVAVVAVVGVVAVVKVHKII